MWDVAQWERGDKLVVPAAIPAFIIPLSFPGFFSFLVF